MWFQGCNISSRYTDLVMQFIVHKSPYCQQQPTQSGQEILLSFAQFVCRIRTTKHQGYMLHEVLPNLGEDLHRRGEGGGRKQETAMCRLRVGHILLTQSYLLKNEEQPFCYACDSLYTVRHILIECPDFQVTRRKYFCVTDMNRLFREVNPSCIVGYLKELGRLQIAFVRRHRDSKVFLAAAILILESFWGRVILACYTGTPSTAPLASPPSHPSSFLYE
ncbi:ribonuclease hi [Plakobranchus ocellatus]|uniref:Ribonuclease hi n=1 Tax=Plakobranchus ocellatus TaxID=259542 RepID=A0AAV4A739_9GAST|nr:ribonuclease hi [Plakobranchus ocellatus]